MAVNKLDITMMEDVGTSANQLLQRDGSGNIPAIDGSLLTGVDPGFTVSTSDPVVTTNPSGGVGSLWYNKTDGEMYCCTDATAGANVWTNVGTGTGDVEPNPLAENGSYALGGTVAGFSCGGLKHSPTNSASNRIDRYAFASSSNSTDHADVVEKHKGGGTGSQSTTHGYGFAGQRGDGYSGPAPGFTDMIQKFAFASGNASDTGYNCILGGRRYSDACATTSYAYIIGGDGVDGGASSGGYVDDSIERFSFSTEANTVDHGNLIGYRNSGMTASGVTHGFYAGGWTNTRPTTTGANTNHIQYFAFASNTTATDAGDLTVARNGGVGWSGPDYGYAAGGWSTQYANTIDKYSLTSNANATDVGDLLDNAGTPSGATTGTTSSGGTSSTTHGYFTFGGGGVPIPTMIQRCAFASDGNATDVGEMTQEGGGGRTGGWGCWD